MMQHKIFTVKCTRCQQPIQPLTAVFVDVPPGTAVGQVYGLEWCASCRAQYVAEFMATCFETAHALETRQEHDNFMDHLLQLYPQHKEQIVAHWLPADCFEA